MASGENLNAVWPEGRRVQSEFLRGKPNGAVAQWRAVEDAVRGMTDPSLESVRVQLVDVLRTNYEAQDE